jgi:hypothetical protein
MWTDSQPKSTAPYRCFRCDVPHRCAECDVPYRCVECDAVIVAANLGTQLTERFVASSGGPVHRVVTVGGVEVHRCLSPFLMLSDSASISAEAAWERIAAARGIVAQETGCSPDEALRALRDRADELGDPIGDLAAEVIDEEQFRVCPHDRNESASKEKNARGRVQ